ncbi:MAG: hypothetical protein DRP71_11505 [Verrucomicrobia bacterium]|nr:MAG: hypothetical protein DRP71_11505 [Verrucomicrobiota bacterium]
MKMRLLTSLAGLTLSVLLPATISAEPLQLSASLESSQVVPDPPAEDPPVDSDAAGEAVMVVEPSTGDFQLTINIVGLAKDDITAVGLHLAPEEENGPLVYKLNPDQFAGDANLLVGHFEDTVLGKDLGHLLAGNIYIKVDTDTTIYPDGEIRGQLMLDIQVGNQLLNFSCRGMINPGNGKAGILIGGFVIDEPGETVLMRCIGDGLTKWGLKSLKDTALYVYDVDGNLIAQNDNWKENGQEFTILASGFAPDRDSDAALVFDFPAGAFTVHADSNKGAGIALVDMYGISAKSVAGIIDAAANGGETAEFTILNQALKDTGLDLTLAGPGPFTLFAPTDAAFGELTAGTLEALTDEELADILRYHIVAANLYSNHLENGPLTTIQGSDLTIDVTDGIKVNDADVIEADLGATNGVVHVIDKVLMPPPPPSP